MFKIKRKIKSIWLRKQKKKRFLDRYDELVFKIWSEFRQAPVSKEAFYKFERNCKRLHKIEPLGKNNVAKGLTIINKMVK